MNYNTYLYLFIGFEYKYMFVLLWVSVSISLRQVALIKIKNYYKPKHTRTNLFSNCSNLKLGKYKTEGGTLSSPQLPCMQFFFQLPLVYAMKSQSKRMNTIYLVSVVQTLVLKTLLARGERQNSAKAYKE